MARSKALASTHITSLCSASWGPATYKVGSWVPQLIVMLYGHMSCGIHHCHCPMAQRRLHEAPGRNSSWFPSDLGVLRKRFSFLSFFFCCFCSLWFLNGMGTMDVGLPFAPWLLRRLGRICSLNAARVQGVMICSFPTHSWLSVFIKPTCTKAHSAPGSRSVLYDSHPHFIDEDTDRWAFKRAAYGRTSSKASWGLNSGQ